MPGLGDVGLGLLIGAAMNRFVGTLEEQRLAIQDQLDAGIAKFGVEVAEALARAGRRKR